jgi:hypothetical protein
MNVALLSREAVAAQGEHWYKTKIRAEVQTEENIGKMIMIDVETGDYELDDEKSFKASRLLKERNPGARLYGLRIGYNVACSVGGSIERTVP